MKTWITILVRARLILAVALLLGLIGFAPTATYAATLNVCPSGCAYSQIQPALDAAANGDTIQIAAGTYNGGIGVYKSVNLVGPGLERPSSRVVIR